MKIKNVVITILVFYASLTALFGQNQNSADRTLRGSARVNASTLGMEFDLPLGGYSGRGINVPIGLSYSSKVWRFEQSGIFVPLGNNGSNCKDVYLPNYSEDSAAGWTNSMQSPYVHYVGMDDIYKAADGQKYFTDNCTSTNPDPQNHSYGYIRRISIHLPSGETHELRMDDTVKSYPITSDCSNPTSSQCDSNDLNLPQNWTGWYYATDGSNLKYYEDRINSSFYLLMSDGSRYDFNSPISNQAGITGQTIRSATKFTERNGNTTTYYAPGSVDSNGIVYPNGYWKDTLDRNIAIPFQPRTPTIATVQTYGMPGMTGEYKFHWKKLKGESANESGLTDFSQPLRYVASNSFTPINPYPAGETLFQSRDRSWVKNRVPGEWFNPIVLSEIELPTGQKYKFTYSKFGIIERIYHPTGGEEKFEYGQTATLSVTDPKDIGNQANLGVIKRQVFTTAETGTPVEWTYNADNTVTANGYTVTINSPDGTRSERVLHRNNLPCPSCIWGNFGYDTALAGMAYEERNYSSENQLVSKKLTNWAKTSLSITGNASTFAEWQPRVTSEESIIYDTLGNGLSTTSIMEYEGDLTQRETSLLTKKSSQYKFVTVGSPLPALPERTSETQYLQSDPNILQSTKDAYKAQNMVGLATSSVVKDAAGTIVSRSEISYDEATYSPNIGRGNPTTSRVWDSTKGNHDNPNAYIETHAKFDIYGNQTESTDAKGNISTTEYDATHHAFPIKVTTPIPSDGVSGSNTAFITTVAYDPTTGLPTSTTDANGLESRIEYDPVTLRPIRTRNYYQNSQVGGTSETVYHDEPNNYWVKSRTQIDETNWSEAITYIDGLGRGFKSEKLDSNGSIFTETEFDSVGRPKRSTNPYRANEAKVWTTTNYDSQSRPFEIVTSDGAKVTTAFGLSTTGNAIGTTVTVTDQANKQRRSITNALGQLTRVDEPNDAGQLDVNGVPAQSTNYIYDTLNNLITVNQGVQTRSFAYDSLSRLKQANNPESGIINYVYDNNSNLTSKTDARNVDTNYIYDNLNRVTNRNYTAPTNLPNYQATPNVAYAYDDTNVAFSKGKLTKVTTAATTTNQLAETKYNSFDILGRVLSHSQITDGNTYNSNYVYNLSGALIEETYPSGRVVKNTLDIDGDLAQVQSRKANDTFKNYANAFTYTSAGAVSSLRLGNGKFENTTFNSRLQPIQIGLGSSATSQNLLKLNFDYGTTAAENNGNVTKQTVVVPTEIRNNVTYNGFTATQNYTYDSLNRLKSAEETIPTQLGWKQTFKYDRYGNREFDTQNNNTNTLANGCPVAVCNPSANPNDNKLVGTNYDVVGNTKIDAHGQTFTYDAENKQTKVVNGQGVILGEYFYDGDGKRIKKIVPSTQETTIFVYDASNKLVAEYSTITASQTEAKISYLTNDHLGSPRITTDGNGQVVSRRDFLPFGEDILRANNGSDSVRQKFTGYERDGETGLDYAKARMFGSGVGRFISPDDFLNDTEPINPQSWNLYTYVRNNPLRLVDPTGEKAKVTINRDKKTKTGTIQIEASFVVYGANGQGVTDDELNEQKDLIEKQLKATYSGKFKGKDGITYEISTNITVEVAGSEKDAEKAVANDVAGNIVEVGNKELMTDQGVTGGKRVNADGASFRLGKEKFDRMKVTLANKGAIDEGNLYSHEFTHLLGQDSHSTNGADVRGGATPTPSALTNRDFGALFSPQIRQLQKETIRRAPILVRRTRFIWK